MIANGHVRDRKKCARCLYSCGAAVGFPFPSGKPQKLQPLQRETLAGTLANALQCPHSRGMNAARIIRLTTVPKHYYLLLRDEPAQLGFS